MSSRPIRTRHICTDSNVHSPKNKKHDVKTNNQDDENDKTAEENLRRNPSRARKGFNRKYFDEIATEKSTKDKKVNKKGRKKSGSHVMLNDEAPESSHIQSRDAGAGLLPLESVLNESYGEHSSLLLQSIHSYAAPQQSTSGVYIKSEPHEELSAQSIHDTDRNVLSFLPDEVDEVDVPDYRASEARINLDAETLKSILASQDVYLLKNSHTYEAIALPSDFSITGLRDMLRENGKEAEYMLLEDKTVKLIVSPQTFLLSNTRSNEVLLLNSFMSFRQLSQLLDANDINVIYLESCSQDIITAQSQSGYDGAYSYESQPKNEGAESDTSDIENSVVTNKSNTEDYLRYEKGFTEEQIRDTMKAVGPQHMNLDQAARGLKTPKTTPHGRSPTKSPSNSQTKKNYDEKQMHDAVMAVVSGGMKIDPAAREFKVPRTTLYMRIAKYKREAAGILPKKREMKKMLTEEEEEQVVALCETMMTTPAGIIRRDVRRFIRELLGAKETTNNKFNYDKGPSDLWFRQFFTRYPHLKDTREVSARSPRGEVSSQQTNKNEAKKWNFKCGICGRRFRNKLTYRTHERTHRQRKTYKCPVCYKIIARDASRLRRHLLIHSDVRPFQCSVCERFFKEKDQLRKHAQIHDPNWKAKKDVLCNICGKAVKARYLRRHQLTHSGERPFVCSICGASFITLQDCKTHESVVHSDARPFQCPHCDKRFKLKSKMIFHQHIHGKKDKPHECEICGQRFILPSRKKAHMFKHFPEESSNVCEICNKRFPTGGALRKHQLVHSTEKKFKCSYCDKRFCRSDNRKRHEMTHTGEKPFKCRVCGLGFCENRYRQVHEKKRHPDAVDWLATQPLGRHVPGKSTGARGDGENTQVPATISGLETVSDQLYDLVSADVVDIIVDPHLHQSKKELVYVTHIKSPCHFSVQQVADIDRLKTLSKNINKFCNSPNSEEARLYTVEIGDLVLGQYEQDRNWYRARVTEVHSDGTGKTMLGATVYYIDYGNSETVALDRLRAMKDRFLKLPELTLSCSLIDIIPSTQSGEWEPEGIASFARMTQDKPMLMTTRGHENSMHLVDLSKPPMDDIEDDRPVSVRDALIFMEYAIFTSPLTDPATNPINAAKFMRKYYSPPLPMKGEKLEVVVSHATSPDSFHVQLMRDAAYLEELMRQLQHHYGKHKGDLYTVYVPQKGMVCAAQYSEDQAWYRALVTALPGRQNVQVTYVDFGNQEIVPYFKLKKILDKFMSLPTQAIECELADVAPIVQDAGWSDQALALFANHCSGRGSVELEVRRVAEDGRKLWVALRDAGSELCLNALLVQYGLATSTGPVSMRGSDKVAAEARPLSQSTMPPQQLAALPPPRTMSREESPAFKQKAKRPPAPAQMAPISVDPSKPPLVEVIVCYVEHPGHLYIQLADPEDIRLDQLMYEMNRALRTSVPDAAVTWSQGDYCSASYSADTKWFRAVIEHVINDQYQVQMIDFGFKDLVAAEKLRVLEPRFQAVEQLSQRCHLVGIQPAGDCKWTQTAIEYLRSRVVNKTLYIALRPSEQEGESHGVDLLLEEKIVGDALSPDQKNYISLAEELKEKGLALPTRRTPRVSPVGSATVIESSAEAQALSSAPSVKSPPRENPRLAIKPTVSNEIPASNVLSKEPQSVLSVKHGAEVKGDSDKLLAMTAQVPDLVPSDSLTADTHESLPSRDSNGVNHGDETASALLGEDSPVKQDMQVQDNETKAVENINNLKQVQNKNAIQSKVEEASQEEDMAMIDDVLAYAMGAGFLDYPPAPPLPKGGDVNVVPTYVDYDGCIYAQVLYPDDSWQGRFGYMLKENTVEVYLQDQVLKALKLHRAKVVRDGNCLFRCIAQNTAVYGHQRGHMEVRLQTLTFINEQWQLFADWFGVVDKGAYLNRMMEEGVYGGEQEIRAMCYCFQVRIRVFLGGLNYPVKCKTFGKPEHPLIQICYICDGNYDSGHYDLVVGSQKEVAEVEEEYFKWRETRVLQFNLERPQFDNSQYEDSLVGQIMLHLQAVYKDSQPEGGLDWQPGELCVCIYSDDGRYYRARVVEVTDNGVKVDYVDFGNSEVVQPDSLRRQPCLPALPRQCVRLALHSIEPFASNIWPVNTLNYMHRLLIESGEACTVHVHYESDGCTLVNVWTSQGYDLTEHLCGNRMAIQLESRAAPSGRPQVTTPYNDEATMRADSPASENSSTAAMSARMVVYGSASPKKVNVDRSVIQKPTQKAADVKPEVSHGADQNATQVKAPDLKSIADRLAHSVRSRSSTPPRTESSLIASPKQRSSPVTNSKGASASAGRVVKEDLEDVGTSGRTLSWGDTMEEAEAEVVPALPPDRLPTRQAPSAYSPLVIADVGSVWACTVTHVVHPQLLYVQHLQQEEKFDETSARVNAELHKLAEVTETLNSQFEYYPDLDPLQPGAQCCARCSLDDAWYRAEVLEVCGSSVGVMYIDYGNSEFVPKDRVKMIPPDLLDLPAQCIAASFHGVVAPPSGFPPDTMNDVMNCVQNQLSIAIIKEKQPSLTLDLYDLTSFVTAQQEETMDQLTSLNRSVFGAECHLAEDVYRGPTPSEIIKMDSDAAEQYVQPLADHESSSGESAIVEEEEGIDDDAPVLLNAAGDSPAGPTTGAVKQEAVNGARAAAGDPGAGKEQQREAKKAEHEESYARSDLGDEVD